MFHCRLHLHNPSLRKSGSRMGEKGAEYVEQFGFGCDTCCGLLPMPNEWRGSWVVSDTGASITHYSIVVSLGVLLSDATGKADRVGGEKCQ